MRLLLKITSAILFGIIVLLVIHGFISIRREVDLFDNDMARDGLLLGHAMKDLVATTWASSGADRALQLVEEANRDEHQIEIRWVWLDAPAGDPFAPKLPPEKLLGLREAQELSYKLSQPGSPGYRLTYVTVPVAADRIGALELSEPLTVLTDYVRRAVTRTTILTAGMILLSSLLIWALGLRYVGRPLEVLIEKTRRVGAGDFGGDVALPGKEELSNLASALNEMCAQLETARETLQRETEARIETLEQLRHTERLATVGRLASGIAHELGTPLNVVAGRAKIIATEELEPKEIVSFSTVIAEQANRMATIIRQLLDFARRRSHERAPVNIVDLADGVIKLLDVTARKSSVALELQSLGEIPLVSADGSQLQQLLTNLVMNAIQAMHKPGKVVVALSVEKARHGQEAADKEYLCIRVKDEGEGITQENLQLIFDPFFTTKGVGRGTGLGLSISHGIVEEHGGWIAVESEIGKGTCFTVYLSLEGA